MHVVQEWVSELTMMQQTVLLTAVRGPDNVTKYHPSKYLLRWFRRCILLSAMDGRVLDDPVEPNGGSFTGPAVVLRSEPAFDGPPPRTGYFASGGLRDRSYHSPDGAGIHNGWRDAMNDWVTEYLRTIDEIPHHFQLHFMHAAEIIGYKHPDQVIRSWWCGVYYRLVKDMHLSPETEGQLDFRLGDDRHQWLETADEATKS